MDPLYTIHSVIILDADGERIASRFFQGPGTVSEQRSFERALHAKTRGAYADIVMLDRHIAVYKLYGDVAVYVLGSHDDNELVLVAALDTLQEALEVLLRGHVSKRALLENFDYVLLAIDETVDKGILIETDAQVIATRCAMTDRAAAFTRTHFFFFFRLPWLTFFSQPCTNRR